MFGAFTYIAYTLTEVSGFAASTVPWLLILFGTGLFAATASAAGRPTGPCPAPCSSCWRALAVVHGGLRPDRDLAGGDGCRPGADGRLRVRHGARPADADHDVRRQAPTLASGANIAAFNVGQRLGAWLGGLTITAGLGYTSTLWAGAALSVGGLVVLAVAETLARSGRDIAARSSAPAAASTSATAVARTSATAAARATAAEVTADRAGAAKDSGSGRAEADGKLVRT